MAEYIGREEFLKRIKPYDTEDKKDKALYNFALNQMMGTPNANVISIPEGATNGDMIKAMFPNCEQKEHMNNRCWKMIAIKGMKMPSGCEVCDFRKSDPYSGEEYCSKAIGSNIIIYEKERLENCPLVEVVTCKDCKYYRNGLEHCTQWVMPTNDDFYCADAERRK